MLTGTESKPTREVCVHYVFKENAQAGEHEFCKKKNTYNFGCSSDCPYRAIQGEGMRYYNEETVKQMLYNRDYWLGNAGVFFDGSYPSIEIPEPHGRLGDLDKMRSDFEVVSKDYPEVWKLVSGIIDRTPTVVEATE